MIRRERYEKILRECITQLEYSIESFGAQKFAGASDNLCNVQDYVSEAFELLEKAEDATVDGEPEFIKDEE